MFRRRYRIKIKKDVFLLQFFSIFRWVTIGEYNDPLKAEIAKNGMSMN